MTPGRRRRRRSAGGAWIAPLAMVAAAIVVTVGGPGDTVSPASAQITIPLTTTTSPPTTTTTRPATTTTAAPTTTQTTAAPTTTPTSEVTTTFTVPPTSPPATFEPLDPAEPPTTSPSPSDDQPPVTTAPPTKSSASITGTVSSVYALGSTATLAFAGLVIGAATQARTATGTGRRFRPIRVSTDHDPGPFGGHTMNEQRSMRLYAGFGFLALAALVALVGYMQLSTEPAVNRQLPYLASAGLATVVLAALGGSLVVGEQLRTETDRVEQLEEAVRILTDIVAGGVEEPPRLRDRSG